MNSHFPEHEIYMCSEAESMYVFIFSFRKYLVHLDFWPIYAFIEPMLCCPVAQDTVLCVGDTGDPALCK